jgi:hypothetical protein
MQQWARISTWCIAVALLITGCNRLPQNAKYIPADAAAVLGVDLGKLSNKIAWSVITGSKLYKEMQRRLPDKESADALKGIENAGIDVSNTFYIYTRWDDRFAGGNIKVALVPLNDATLWQAYVTRVFKGAKVQQMQHRSEATLADGMHAGWTDHLLVIVYAQLPDDDREGSYVPLSEELSRVFSLSAGQSLAKNERFVTIARGGHDVCFWMNYGNLLSDVTHGVSLAVNGVSLSPAVWKDAALAAGANFRKGQIVSEINYYLPAKIEEGTTDFGIASTDADMLDRLPGDDVDMLMTTHISPAGIKTILEKVGLLGPANVGLTAKGMDVDGLLDAFTGDMAVVIQGFGITAETQTDMFMGEMVQHKKQHATMNLTYVLKIKNYDNFKLLLQKTAAQQMVKVGDEYQFPLTTRDTLFLLPDKQYAVFSNHRPTAKGVQAGTFSSGTLPAAAHDNAYNYPFAFFLNVQQMLGKVQPSVSSSVRDSAVLSESKKLIDNVAFYGGDFTDKAYHFRFEINFLEKDENSILELIDFGMRVNDLVATPH